MTNENAMHRTNQRGHKPRRSTYPSDRHPVPSPRSDASTQTPSQAPAQPSFQRTRRPRGPQQGASSGKALTRVLLILALVIILISAIGLGIHRVRVHRPSLTPGIEETQASLVEEHDLQGVMALIDQTIMEKGQVEFLGASQEQLVSSYFLPCDAVEAAEEVEKVFSSRGWKDLGFGEPGEMVIYGQATQEPDEPDRAVVMFIEEEGGCTVVIEFLRWGSAS